MLDLLEIRGVDLNTVEFEVTVEPEKRDGILDIQNGSETLCQPNFNSRAQANIRPGFRSDLLCIQDSGPAADSDIRRKSLEGEMIEQPPAQGIKDCLGKLDLPERYAGQTDPNIIHDPGPVIERRSLELDTPADLIAEAHSPDRAFVLQKDLDVRNIGGLGERDEVAESKSRLNPDERHYGKALFHCHGPSWPKRRANQAGEKKQNPYFVAPPHLCPRPRNQRPRLSAQPIE